jgi:guanine deaminase
MQLAIETAKKGVEAGFGGPSGTVIVRSDKVIVAAHVEVFRKNDPTAHSIIVAIRKATAKLGRFDISDCELYCTCEPCSMCLSAIHWAGIKKLYFGASRHDVTGSDPDNHIYQLMNGTVDSSLLRTEIVNQKECVDLIKGWNAKSDRVVS